MVELPRPRARLAGALYLISGVPAVFSVFVLFKLVVRGNPAATATNILASEGLFRLGLVADVVGILIYAAAVLCLYELFKPAGKLLAQLYLFVNLLGCGIQALDASQDSAALLLLKGGTSVAGLTAEQAKALAFLFLRLHILNYNLALVFFGCAGLAVGFLIFRSSFLPRALGILMLIDGLGYLTFSLATFLSPSFAIRLHPFLPFATAALGELSLVLWLLVKGVNEPRWREQGAAAGG